MICLKQAEGKHAGEASLGKQTHCQLGPDGGYGTTEEGENTPRAGRLFLFPWLRLALLCQSVIPETELFCHCAELSKDF